MSEATSPDKALQAKARMERAFRVKYDREPSMAQEQTLILMAQDRIADGSSFRWEGAADNPQLRFGTADEEDETATENDLMALEAEEAVRIQEAVAKYGVSSKTSVTDSSSVELPKLTEKEASFCRLIAAGQTQINAYYLAGYKASNRKSAYACASQIAAREHVSIYLRKLRESTFLAHVLTLGEKRKGLADVWRTPVGEVDENHPLAQEVKRRIFTDKEGNKTGEEVTVKMPSKLAALELDAKLAGELREQTQVSATFNFATLNQELPADVVEVEPEKRDLPE